MYYVDEDYPSWPEIQKPLPERSNRYGSESSTLETDDYVWRYILLVVFAIKEERKRTNGRAYATVLCPSVCRL